MSPGLARLYCVPVHYTDLWKIRAPLHEVEGFKMTHFDAIIEAAASVSDNTVEPHPLWEYPAIALGEATLIAELDITTTEVPSYNIEFSGECLVMDRSKVSYEIEMGAFYSGMNNFLGSERSGTVDGMAAGC